MTHGHKNQLPALFIPKACKALSSKTFLFYFTSFLLFFFYPQGKLTVCFSCCLENENTSLSVRTWGHHEMSVALPSLTWELLHGFRSPISAQPGGLRPFCTELQEPLIPNSSPSSLHLPCHHGPLFLKMFISENWMLLLENWRLKEPNCTSVIVNFVSEQKEKLIKDGKSSWSQVNLILFFSFSLICSNVR